LAGFFPPPPSFVGGHQPWAANATIVDLQTNSPPPSFFGGVNRYQQDMAAFAWQPQQPLVQQPSRFSITGGPVTNQPPPVGWPITQAIAAEAYGIGWTPAPFPVQQKPALQRISGPPVVPPAPPPPPPGPFPPAVFPHDEYDDGWSFWKNTKRQDEAERLRQARIEIGLLPPDEEPTEAEEVREQINAGVSVDEIAQRLSAHFYAKYQTNIRQAQAKADLEREAQRRRQDYLLSSAERAQRIEQGKRLALRKAIEEDDARVMALLNDLL
jgi:hypothetical protein